MLKIFLNMEIKILSKIMYQIKRLKILIDFKKRL